MIMHKRGDVRTKVIVIAIAVFVLGMLFFGGIPLLIEQTKKLRDFVSSGSGDYASASAKGPEYVRYNIDNGKVQWHDGTDWRDFEGGVAVINGKKVDMTNVKNDLFNLYFNFQQGGEITTNILDKPADIQGVYREMYLDYGASFFNKILDLNRPTKKPIVLLCPNKECNRKCLEDVGFSFQIGGSDFISYTTFEGYDCSFSYGIFILGHGGSKKIIRLKNDNSCLDVPVKRTCYELPIPAGAKYNKIFDLMEKEINKILNKPTSIKYSMKDNNGMWVEKTPIEFFCVKKYDNKYLVVDLSKPVSENCNCETLIGCEVNEVKK